MKREETFYYLSDQELEQLIAMVEQEELIPAPPDLAEGVLGRLQVDVPEQGAGEQQAVPEKYIVYWDAESEQGAAGCAGEMHSVPGAVSEKLAVVQSHAREERIREFRRYCFRVITSAAAALVLLFTLPTFLDTQSRNEQKHPTREEVLSEKGLWESATGSKKIFSAGSGLFDR